MSLAARLSTIAAAIVLTAGFTISAASIALAQTPVIVAPGGGINQGRHCQNVRICNSLRPGARCTGAYACRVCDSIPTRCTVGTAGPVCHRLRCTWN